MAIAQNGIAMTKYQTRMLPPTAERPCPETTSATSFPQPSPPLTPAPIPSAVDPHTVERAWFMASRWSAPLYERPGRHGPRLLDSAWVDGGRDGSSPRAPLRTGSPGPVAGGHRTPSRRTRPSRRPLRERSLRRTRAGDRSVTCGAKHRHREKGSNGPKHPRRVHRSAGRVDQVRHDRTPAADRHRRAARLRQDHAGRRARRHPARAGPQRHPCDHRRLPLPPSTALPARPVLGRRLLLRRPRPRRAVPGLARPAGPRRRPKVQTRGLRQ